MFCSRTLSLFAGGTRRLFSSSANIQLQKNVTRNRVIFSGIQPTGVPHLGNYLGALSNWVKLQQEASLEDELLFSIVGWHALTLPQNPKELSNSRMDMLATLLAIGLDPKRSVIFHQDDNQCHTELSWILSCLTPIGDLRRMTTWKSRLATSRNTTGEHVDESMLNAGLFTYPILQAADILVYRATHVPVGEDQTQHLELCRTLANAFNRRFKSSKPLFHLPEQLNTPYKRILSLRDPSSKMSKSAPDVKSRILLTDTASQIHSKVRSAVTDTTRGVTYDPTERPGIANLLSILGACTNEDPAIVATRYQSKGHESLKADVAEAVDVLLKGPREEFERLKSDPAYLTGVAKTGALKSREKAALTMCEVRRKVGLY